MLLKTPQPAVQKSTRLHTEMFQEQGHCAKIKGENGRPFLQHVGKSNRINNSVEKKTPFTLPILLEAIALPGKAKSFSTPPVSFQCINFLVGGAKSNVVTISEVSDNCSFIVSLGIPFCSSTTSFLFRLAFLSVPNIRKDNKIILAIKIPITEHAEQTT